MNIEEIAQELRELNERIVLIFAFNATGKTQLSVAYKNLTKNEETEEHAGVYYNAYSEDLFTWDNDEDNDNANVSLKVLPSSLNQFHSYLHDNQESIMEKLALYEPRFRFTLNAYDDIEKGIESVKFYLEENEDTAIKISRGEERIFIWCFFLALLEVDGWADQQNAHIFIDDPVSSLDEHNIYVTADSIFKQIEKHYETDKRIFITTHHIGLYAILADRLKKGEKSDRYREITGLRILKRADDGVVLDTPGRNVFLYHLHLLQILNEARNSQLYNYHFAMLRQLLENTSSFLGTARIGRTLSKIGIEDTENAITRINGHSHKTAYYYQSELMNDADQSFFIDVLDKLIQKHEFSF